MKEKFVILLLLALCFTKIQAQAEERILGKWTNEDKTQIIEVVKKNNVYVGKLVFINVENAKLMLDSKNDEEALRNRRLIGAEVWTNFEYLEDKDMWKYGTIYNYKTGNSYNGKIQIEWVGWDFFF